MPQSITAQIKRSVASIATHSLFHGANSLGLLNVGEDQNTADLRVFRNIAYGDHDRARLDVIRPATGAVLGVVMHVHGGGFTLLSKDTHWMVAEAYARAGFVVFNVNYRLAPEHPYPAALEDASAAYAWIVEHAAEYGGSLDTFILTGESAGANLITGLAVSATMQRSEPFARTVYDTGVVPTAVVPASGLLDLSNAGRFRGLNPTFVVARQEVERIRVEYLAGADETGLASPLIVLEGETPTDRPLPAFFVPFGGGDPLRGDSERLVAALQKRGVVAEGRRYGRETHSFHVFMWREQARRCWRDIFAFLRDDVELRLAA